jgi:hypothetical protein
MAEPPVESGACQTRTTEASFGSGERLRGALGVQSGVMGGDVGDAALMPAEVVAVTVKV